jgi:predicted ArsR family transcriptional regulator
MVISKALMRCPMNMKCMPSRFREKVYAVLTKEPVTVNEVAIKLGISHKTAKSALMELALTKPDVRYKNSGRIHIF